LNIIKISCLSLVLVSNTCLPLLRFIDGDESVMVCCFRPEPRQQVAPSREQLQAQEAYRQIRQLEEENQRLRAAAALQAQR